MVIHLMQAARLTPLYVDFFFFLLKTGVWGKDT